MYFFDQPETDKKVLFVYFVPCRRASNRKSTLAWVGWSSEPHWLSMASSQALSLAVGATTVPFFMVEYSFKSSEISSRFDSPNLLSVPGRSVFTSRRSARASL